MSPGSTSFDGAGSIRVRVADEIGVFSARSRARSIARDLGFSSIEVAELVIVVSELAWNIVKHAQRGEIELLAIDDAERGTGLVILARDRGPPFHDFATALLDRHDDRGPIDPMDMWRRKGLGSGLGAVSRLTDELSCVQRDGEKCFRAMKFPRRPRCSVP